METSNFFSKIGKNVVLLNFVFVNGNKKKGKFARYVHWSDAWHWKTIFIKKYIIFKNKLKIKNWKYILHELDKNISVIEIKISSYNKFGNTIYKNDKKKIHNFF